MSTNDKVCERKQQLLEDLLRLLSSISDASESEAEVPHNGSSGANTPLEQPFAKRERAVSALKKHLEEHGC